MPDLNFFKKEAKSSLLYKLSQFSKMVITLKLNNTGDQPEHFYRLGQPWPPTSRLSTAPGVYLARLQAPSPAPSHSFTLSLRDEAAHVPVTLRASFADRTLAWVSRWGRKKLILAPFLFYPQRFFEVGQSPDPWSLWGGVQSCTPIRESGGTSGEGGRGLWSQSH